MPQITEMYTKVVQDFESQFYDFLHRLAVEDTGILQQIIDWLVVCLSFITRTGKNVVELDLRKLLVQLLRRTAFFKTTLRRRFKIMINCYPK